MEQLLSELIGLVQESTAKKETRREELIRVLSYIQTLCDLNQIVLFDDEIDYYTFYRFYFDKDDDDLFWKTKKEITTNASCSDAKKIYMTKYRYCNIVDALPKILEKEIKKFADESEAAEKITKMLNVIN